MTSSSKNKRPRILMLLSGLPPMPVGGAEVQAFRLCKQLRAQGLDVNIVTWGKLWHSSKGEFNGISFTRVRSLFSLIVDVPSLFKTAKKTGPTKIEYDDSREVTNAITGKVWTGMILRYRLVYFSWLIYLYFRRSTFDIIHVHMLEWPAIVGVKIGRRLNKPVLIKDSTMNGIFNLLRYPSGKEKQRDIISHGHFVAMTKMIEDNLLKAGVAPTRITRIPNGIDVLAMPEKTINWANKVVFVGNLTQQPAKGLDILLKAWQLVQKKIPAAHLQIVGNGDIPAYERYCESFGIQNTVQFLGGQKNTRDILLRSNIFVLPSRREGMSNALMEAMLCALPVVVTDVSGSKDLVEDGISGKVVPPADVNALASALIHLLENPEIAVAMGQMAYKSVVHACDMKKVGQQYENLYLSLV